ncbi:MAG: archaeal proteasome endopeptidase complex subunit alpha [Nanoarchaeota archaeon]
MQQDQQQMQMMGYDRASTVFSPDGRLLQVEYAKKTVRQGTSAIGMVCKDGVVLMADKRVLEKFVISKSIEKVFQVDEHIGATASGLIGDARVLIERAQIVSQQHKITYDEPIDMQSLVKDVCNVKQAYTQYGGARPFGVSIIFAGIDENEPRVFLTDITGIYFEYKVAVIGEAEDRIKAIFEKEYKDNLIIDDGIMLGIKSLKKVLGKDFDLSRIECIYIKTSEKKFTRLEQSSLKKYL